MSEWLRPAIMGGFGLIISLLSITVTHDIATGVIGGLLLGAAAADVFINSWK